jgi:hypothetical protein
MRNKSLLLLFVLLIATGVFTPTFAEPAPCPSSFLPFPIPVAPGDEGVDRNGNGLVCIKPVPGQGGGNSTVEGFVVKDDRASGHDTE